MHVRLHNIYTKIDYQGRRVKVKVIGRSVYQSICEKEGFKTRGKHQEKLCRIAVTQKNCRTGVEEHDVVVPVSEVTVDHWPSDLLPLRCRPASRAGRAAPLGAGHHARQAVQVRPGPVHESGTSTIHIGTSSRSCDGTPHGTCVTWGCTGSDWPSSWSSTECLRVDNQQLPFSLHEPVSPLYAYLNPSFCSPLSPSITP